MPVYFCRWTNGDLSVVTAPNKKAAMVALDEIGDAGDPTVELFQVKGDGYSFMVHFKLNDRGRLELDPLIAFGEVTDEWIDRAYPVLTKARMNAESDELDDDGLAKAVAAERARLTPPLPPLEVEAVQ